MSKSKCAISTCMKIENLKACSACNDVMYCGRECQVKHFKEGGHKLICAGRSKEEGKKGPLTFADCHEKAIRYQQEEMWASALPYFCALLELTERPLGIMHPQVGNLLSPISMCYRKLDRYQEAVACMQRMIVVKEIHNDGSEEKNKELFNIMGLMAQIYVEMGSVEYARDMMKKMQEAAKESFGEDSFERGRALNALGAVLDESGDKPGAEAVLREAIGLSGFVGATERSQRITLSTAHFNLGVLLATMSNYTEAIEQLSRSIEVKVECGVHDDDRDLMEAKENLTRVQSEQGATTTLQLQVE